MATFLTYFAATMGVGVGVVITTLILRFLPQSPYANRIEGYNEKSLAALTSRNEISKEQLELFSRIAEAVKYMAYDKD